MLTQSRRRRIFGALIALAAATGIAESSYGTPSIARIRMSAEAQPGGNQIVGFPYVGPCPVRVRFVAHVSAMETKYIRYRWERSDAPSDTRDRRAEITWSPMGGAWESPIEDVRMIDSLQSYVGEQTLVILQLVSGDNPPAYTTGQPVRQKISYQVTCWASDLAIVSITNVPLFVESSKPCGDPIYQFRLTVKGQGSTDSDPTDLWVVSQDYKVPNKLTADGGWGSSVRIPHLNIGESKTIDVPILYLQHDPTFMGSQPHTFSAVVDPLGRMRDSNRMNNTATISVDAPVGCPMARGDAPPQKAPPATHIPAQQPQSASVARKDASNCSDHPLFKRVQDYWIESCAVKALDSYNFDAGKKRYKAEGKYWYIRYQPPPGLSAKPSTAQVLHDASATIKNAGAEVVAADSSKETLRLVRDGRETWIEAWADHTGKYILTIVEKAIH